MYVFTIGKKIMPVSHLKKNPKHLKHFPTEKMQVTNYNSIPVYSYM